MRQAIFMSTMAIALATASPTIAAEPSRETAMDCTTTALVQHPQPGNHHGAAQMPARCPDPGAKPNPDIGMLAMLALGVVIIGLPAARRRKVPVVFS